MQQLSYMDIEFHYYINYLVALNAGFLPDVAEKIAYSAQYVDDNTDHYSITSNSSSTVYHNIVTQSFNTSMEVDETVKMYPIFHFIPGDNVIKSSVLRRDGECRYTATIPNSKLAKKMLREALYSNNPHWIGIASHAFVDTWAHQNFTGLKDCYNCVYAYRTNENLLSASHSTYSDTSTNDENSRKQYCYRYNTSSILTAINIPCIGHMDVLHLPDTVNGVWYDYRLKEMQINNNERILSAAEYLFIMYVKYAKQQLLSHVIKDPRKQWQILKKILQAIFSGQFDAIRSLQLNKNKDFMRDYIGFHQYNKLMLKVLGTNKTQRIDAYVQVANSMVEALYNSKYKIQKYDKLHWFNSAVQLAAVVSNDNAINCNKKTLWYEASDTVLNTGLSDSGSAYYGCEKQDSDNASLSKLKRKLCNMLFDNQNIFEWQGNYKNKNWYLFQEAVVQHSNFMLEKVKRIIKKDVPMIQRYDSKYSKVLASLL